MFVEPLIGSNNGKKGGGVIGGITKGLMKIKNVIDVFRNMVTVVLRQLFSSLVENTVNRMKNSFGTIIYLQEKLKVMIKKQSALFEVLKQFANTLPFLFTVFHMDLFQDLEYG